MPLASGLSKEASNFEINGHGIGDNRPSPIIVQKANGNYETNFLCKSFNILDFLTPKIARISWLLFTAINW